MGWPESSVIDTPALQDTELQDGFHSNSAESRQRTNSSEFALALKFVNFSLEEYQKAPMPVRLEQVSLSADYKSFGGIVAIQNIAYQKSVATYFTLDNWKTISKVFASYSKTEGPPLADGYDRFVFKIDLSSQANLASKTIHFCIRYNVNGQEYWDNNASHNYQVQFLQQGNLPAKRGHKSKSVILSNRVFRRNSSPRSSTPRLNLESVQSLSGGALSRSAKSTLLGQHIQLLSAECKFKMRVPASNTAIFPSTCIAQSTSEHSSLTSRYEFDKSAAISEVSSCPDVERELYETLQSYYRESAQRAADLYANWLEHRDSLIKSGHASPSASLLDPVAERQKIYRSMWKAPSPDSLGRRRRVARASILTWHSQSTTSNCSKERLVST